MLSTRIIQASKGVPYGFQEYTTPGPDTFNIPGGVTEVRITVIGGGGGGGAGDKSVPIGGGGGGAGGFYRGTIAVTPFGTLSVTVGEGGDMSLPSNGGTSRVEIIGSSYVEAYGGVTGDFGGFGGAGGAGGGGTINGGTFIDSTTGSNGSNATTSTGANGGGRFTPGFGTYTATGGTGTNTFPVAGSGPGYGAAGGGAVGGNYVGGIGGNGYVLIEWGY